MTSDDILEHDELQELVPESFGVESYDDTETDVVASLDAVLDFLEQDNPTDTAGLESFFDETPPVMESDGTESYVKNVKDMLHATALKIMAFFRRAWRWIVGLFKHNKDRPKETAAMAKEAVDLDKTVSEAKSALSRTEAMIDEALLNKKSMSSEEEQNALMRQLVENYDQPLTQTQIKSMPSRKMLRSVIQDRLGAYTNNRLNRITNRMTADKYHEFGLMASAMMDNLIKDYRQSALSQVKFINEAVIMFRRDSKLTDEVIDKIDSARDEAARSADIAFSKYLDSFGKNVTFAGGGTGINTSSIGTVAKTLKVNVNGLIELISKPDEKQQQAFSFETLDANVKAFLKISDSMGSDHTSTINSLLSATDSSLKGLTDMIASFSGDTRKRNQKINKFFSSALMDLQASAMIAREVAKVYDAFLKQTTSMVSAYVDIVNYHHRDVHTALDYYLSITEGFKQRQLSQIADKLTVSKAKMITARDKLRALFENNKRDANKEVGKIDLFEYAGQGAPERPKYNPKRAQHEAKHAEALGYDTKLYPGDTRRRIRVPLGKKTP